MHGLKNMPQIAAMGGNGGYAQSLATKQQLNYENNRDSIYQNYMDNLRELETAKANGIVAANQDYLTDMAGRNRNTADTAVNAAEYKSWQTYKEIVAFSEGKLLDDIHKQREIDKRLYQKILLVIGSAVLTFVVCVLIGFLMHIFFN